MKMKVTHLKFASLQSFFFGATATSHITSKRVDIQIPSFRISYTYSIFSKSYEMK